MAQPQSRSRSSLPHQRSGGRPVLSRGTSQCRDGLTARALYLAVALFLGGVWAISPALAASSGGGGGHGGGSGSEANDRPDKETVLPRTEADHVPGEYMQLNVVWLPIYNKNRSRYQSVTVRLVPHPEHRVAACFKAPWAHEAILMELTKNPMTVDDITHLKDKTLKARLLARIDSQVGRDLYTDVILASGAVPADPESQRLSEMCR